MDIIDIPLQERANVLGQPEDWLIEPNHPWLPRGQFGRDVVRQLAQYPTSLWNDQSSHRNDRVTASFVHNSLASLHLVQVHKFEIVIEEKIRNDQLTKKPRAHFLYRGVRYNFGLTDPAMQERYFPQIQNMPCGPIMNGPSQTCHLCLSLGLEFHGYHYKLVAAVIE